MSAVPPFSPRSQIARPDKSGTPTFDWSLTHASLIDTVKLVTGPFNVLPVVFVPGIMGSNLKSINGGQPVWRLDTTLGKPIGLLRSIASKGPGERQKMLHPDRCEVDDGGALPSSIGGSVYSTQTYKERGWGTVAEGSYHDFLLWLERELNPVQRNPAMWQEYYQAEATIDAPPAPNTQPKLFPGIRMGMKGQPFNAERHPFASIMTDDLIARGKFFSPVYAAGYNWLASNEDASKALSRKIQEIIASYNKGSYRCEQVVLVTHSMGGLVARACARLPGMADRIAGILHGVMPAVGAAVAYRRCKLGMREEDFGAGLVIGSNGQEVTAVFAQAPGALQLLPSQLYNARWLRIQARNGQAELVLPAAGQQAGTCDPYTEIYAVRDKWWGLVKEQWLAPTGGQPISWDVYVRTLDKARDFHAQLGKSYHPNTYSFYGADPKKKSFETMRWTIAKGIAPDSKTPPSTNSVLGMSPTQVRMDGTNPGYVGGHAEVSSDWQGNTSVYETSYWELHGDMQDGAGDGTVPTSSGAAPLAQGGGAIRQQFKLTGIEHEPAYRDATVQKVVLYAMAKIAGTAKKPS
jgi:pimeloyl-ACP methyl ester carboxylesterase